MASRLAQLERYTTLKDSYTEKDETPAMCVQDLPACLASRAVLALRPWEWRNHAAPPASDASRCQQR